MDPSLRSDSLPTCSRVTAQIVRKAQPDDLMTNGEAARLLGLSPDMVRIRERDGRSPAQPTTNDVRFLRRGDVEHLLAERSRAASKEDPSPARPGQRTRGRTEGDK